jgi:lipopolysaccharide transport system permease protein
MAWYRVWPGGPFFLLPVFIVWTFLLSLGAGCLFSALLVRFRDMRFILGFLLQFGIFITPVGFSSHLIPAEYRTWYALNPMVGVIDGFRWCILGEAPEPLSMLISALVTGLLCLLGVRYFRSREKNLADFL